jgi:hypothetical protein
LDADTWIVKAAKPTTVDRSVTEMLIGPATPTFEGPGVPDNWPVDALKAAQAGLPDIWNVSGSPSRSTAAGWNV